MVRQGVDVDVGITVANVRQQLRERVPGELIHEAGGGDGALCQQAIDLAGGHRRIEEEDDHRAVDPGAVQVDVRPDDAGQVGQAQSTPPRCDTLSRYCSAFPSSVSLKVARPVASDVPGTDDVPTLMTSWVPVRLAIAGPCLAAVAEAVVNAETTSTLAIAKSRLIRMPPPQPQAP